jgi:hypothetical protein
MERQNSLIINFYYGMDDLDPLFELEEKLRVLIDDGQLGHYDGHAVNMDGSDGILFMYGNDPEQILEIIKPTLLQTSFMKEAEVHIEILPSGESRKRSFVLE